MFAPDVDPNSAVPLDAAQTLTSEDENLKRPPNAFILFYRAVHAAVLTDHLDLPELEINRLIGQMWRATEESTRAFYREQAKNLAEAFREIHPDYDEQRHKKPASRSALVKLPEPIRLKVILNDPGLEITPGPGTSNVSLFE
jgi:hypothetical protein